MSVLSGRNRYGEDIGASFAGTAIADIARV
jgi:hypothetical protein